MFPTRRQRPWGPISLLVFAIGCLVVGWVLPTLAGATPAAGDASSTPALPQLQFEDPDGMAPLVERLQALDPEPLHAMAKLLGLRDLGGPIRVRLVSENNEAAGLVPRWAVAYAIGNASLVVLIPNRIPGYPDKDLETVLYHEIAHVLVSRAAGRRPVPRWFNEGIAMVAARESGPGWGFGDQGRLLWATIRRDGSQLVKLEQRFAEGPHSAAEAYSLSAAFVRFVRDEFGAGAIARILSQVRGGKSFETAFLHATGTPLYVAEETFWQELDISHKWIPFLTSSATLWMIVTLLALWAFRRRRQLDAQRLAQWEEEEAWQELERSTVIYTDAVERRDPYVH